MRGTLFADSSASPILNSCASGFFPKIACTLREGTFAPVSRFCTQEGPMADTSLIGKEALRLRLTRLNKLLRRSASNGRFPFIRS
jgi:hypothetical protein